MKKLIISLTCAAICCACEARHNKTAVGEQNTTQTTVIAEANDNEGVDVGQIAPDFTLNDINGKPLALSSLRGKYVIVDFWGSWCIWCIKGMPKMKEYYSKYADKLEILGVDCNDPEAKWKDAVKRLELPWKNVYTPKGEMSIIENYELQGFPTKILIDPEGKVVKYVCGEDPAFYQVLDEVLK